MSERCVGWTMAEEQTGGSSGDRPRTVVELVELLQRTRGALEQMAAGMSDDALVATSGGWSAKDHLAHVAAWERRLIGEIQGDRAVERFGLDAAAFEAATTDSLNAMIHARYRDDSPATVRAEFRAAGEALYEVIAGLSDADLMQPVRPDDPDVDTLVELIGWDTFWHYPQHTEAIAGQA